MLSNKIKRILVETSRFVLGAVFIFSGFVKAVDPMGSAYKLQDYMTAFGLEMFSSVALPFFVGLSVVEFVLGVCILLGVYRRFTTIMIFAFMLVMTPFTLYLAINNPVTDCGCFGDALPITNWETFYKNIALLLTATIVFLWYKFMKPFYTPKSYSLVMLYTSVFIVGLSVTCYYNLPVLDFRPYKIGVDINKSMAVPEGVPHDEYETTFIYEKDGKQQEFTLNDYPADDTTWRFVDSKSHLIKKGYQPPIHDFSITRTDGEDITQNVLSDTTNTFLLIAHKLDKADDSNVDKINDIYDFSQRFGYHFYALTASVPDEIREWTEDTGAEYGFYTTDDITLKTIIRSNPGLMLVRKGIIINKWSHRDLPSGEELKKSLRETKLDQIPPNRNVLKVFLLALILIIPLFLLFIADFTRQRKNKERTISDEEQTIN